MLVVHPSAPTQAWLLSEMQPGPMTSGFRGRHLSASGGLVQLRQARVALLGGHVPDAVADPRVKVETLVREEQQRAGLRTDTHPYVLCITASSLSWTRTAGQGHDA